MHTVKSHFVPVALSLAIATGSLAVGHSSVDTAAPGSHVVAVNTPGGDDGNDDTPWD